MEYTSNLKGQRILFIGVGFHNYDQAICNELERCGANVYYFSSKPSHWLQETASKLGLHALENYMRRRTIKSRVERSRHNNDIVFIIKGECLEEEDLKTLKRNNPNAEWKLYLWDSLARHSNLDTLFQYTDKVWSFDRMDCERSDKLIFRPLFCIDNGNKLSKIKYTLSFIGAIHSNRFELARRVRDVLRRENKEYYIKLYIGFHRYFWHRYITHKISNDDAELYMFKFIPTEQHLEIIQSSLIVFDVSNTLQSGLTIRSIEALSYGCHLLTTNKDIKNYDDIPSSCYTIVDCDQELKLPNVVAKTDLQMVNYTVSKFIYDIFN